MTNLDPLLKPSSVAIVGASKDFSSMNGLPLKYLLMHGYRGKIFPVNPRYDSISGLKCFPSIQDVPEDIDNALIVVSRKYVLEVLEKCSEKGIKAAVIISAGFAESGEEGKRLQEKIQEIAYRNNMVICGPNCVGIINFIDRIPLTFSPYLALSPMTPGKIGFISQSGALMCGVANQAQDRGIGFSYLISSGNEAVLEASDYIKFLIEDASTEVIVAIIEGFRDGRKFLDVTQLALEREKPLVVLKAGRSEKGQKAIVTHTGALAGSDAVCNAVFKQRGVIRVERLEELVETAALLSRYKNIKGDRIVILTGSGGAGTLMADLCDSLGLNLIELPSSVKQNLKTILPEFISEPSNPLDFTPQVGSQPDILNRFLDAFIQDEEIDIIVVAATGAAGSGGAGIASTIGEAVKKTHKPVLACLAGGSSLSSAIQICQEKEVISSRSLDICIKSLSNFIAYQNFLKKFLLLPLPATSGGEGVGGGDIFPKDLENLLTGRKGEVLTEYESKRLLAKYQIPITREEMAFSLNEAIGLANKIGYPIVLKIMCPQIIHKSDAKIIKLNINNDEELKRGYQEIWENAISYNPQAQIEGVLVQEMLHEGFEVIVGVVNDTQFGPVIMLGLGGIFVEVFRDNSFRLIPLTRSEAKEMLKEIKGYKLLEGIRGRPPADVEGIIDVLLKISKLAYDLKGIISELDINPLMVFAEGRGVKVVDALIKLQGATKWQ